MENTAEQNDVYPCIRHSKKFITHKRDKGKSKLFFPNDYTIVDIETTGLSPTWNKIIDVAAIRVRSNKMVKSFHSLVKYTDSNKIPEKITKLTGITEKMILNEGKLDTEVFPKLVQFIGNDLILGYWVNFDINFLYDVVLKMFDQKLNNDFVDVWRIACKFYPDERHNRLEDCIERIHINHEQAHRGLQDCQDTFSIYNYFKQNIDSNTLKSITEKKSHKNFDFTTLKSNNDDIDTDNPFYKQFICFTGTPHIFSKKSMEAQFAVDLGGIPQNSVTKKTAYLIVADTKASLHGKGTVTGKLKKAQKLIAQGQDLTIMDESTFFDVICDYLDEV